MKPGATSKAAAWLTLGLVLLVAARQWYEIYDRLHLFVVGYDCRTGQSHVADGAFVFIYLINAALLTVTCAAACWLWSSRAGRPVAVALLALNAVAMVTWFVMHRTGALVTYSEFIAGM